MILSNEQLNTLSDIALSAVIKAGRYINEFDKSQLKYNLKNTGSSLSAQVVTEVDFQSQAIIIEALQPVCEQYDIALLSEENCSEVAIEQHDRLSKDFFWCIDPLDGTLPFIEGNEGYAISVALVSNYGKPILSAIYLPASDVFYQTKISDLGDVSVYKNGRSFVVDDHKQTETLTFFCDKSFVTSPQYPLLIDQLSTLLPELNVRHLQIINTHGAVVNALSVLNTPPSLYLKLPKKNQGGGAIWDFSGTACITSAVGAWVSDIHGSPLELNKFDDYYMHKKGVIYASDSKLANIAMQICHEYL